MQNFILEAQKISIERNYHNHCIKIAEEEKKSLQSNSEKSAAESNEVRIFKRSDTSNMHIFTKMFSSSLSVSKDFIALFTVCFVEYINFSRSQYTKTILISLLLLNTVINTLKLVIYFVLLVKFLRKYYKYNKKMSAEKGNDVEKDKAMAERFRLECYGILEKTITIICTCLSFSCIIIFSVKHIVLGKQSDYVADAIKFAITTLVLITTIIFKFFVLGPFEQERDDKFRSSNLVIKECLNFNTIKAEEKIINQDGVDSIYYVYDTGELIERLKYLGYISGDGSHFCVTAEELGLLKKFLDDFYEHSTFHTCKRGQVGEECRKLQSLSGVVIKNLNEAEQNFSSISKAHSSGMGTVC